MKLLLKEIREKFIKFFIANGHKKISSSSLIPSNDPTLMFTNSGMVQFKNIFVGNQETKIKEVVSSQKCLRVGGKHNDFENIGYTTRHHTFFEMLGNFSFGNYFKETAIELAWKFITQELSIDKKRLFITVYHNDDESYKIWKKISGFLNEKIIKVSTNDNFWSMGNTGPCGPCSEIFYDHLEPNLQYQDRIVEIWNLVFMEFNKNVKGDLQKLPKKCIDTGMGLERITAIMQNVHDNYDIDLFSALINKSQEICKNTKNKLAYRIIVDHLRAASFLIAEGILPGNEGRNYVVRKLIRRASSYIHLLGYNDSLLHQIFPLLIDKSSLAYMGDCYPELIRARKLIKITLKSEEENFKDILVKGVSLLQKNIKNLKPGNIFPGEYAFKLYDTYGFPLDITLDILKEKKIKFDKEEFNILMNKQKEKSRAKWIGSGEKNIEQIWFELFNKFGKTEFVGYNFSEVINAKVITLISIKNEIVSYAKEGEIINILLDKTPFYGQSGGQIGDSGIITVIESSSNNKCLSRKNLIIVENTNKINNLHLHICRVKFGSIFKGDIVKASINKKKRQNLKRNHSATHLLHFALKRILNNHINQKGSLILPDKLRFDFNYKSKITQNQLFAIENMVNNLIRKNFSTSIKIQNINQAIKEGAIALFGEKYEKLVRVIKIGNSKELCGGTHIKYTGEIGLFKITTEYSISSGIRRIEALTGKQAINYIHNNEINLKKISEYIKTPVNQIKKRIITLNQERKEFKSQIKTLYKKLIEKENIKSTIINGLTFTSYAFTDIPLKIIKELILKQKELNTITVFTLKEKNKTLLILKISKDLTKLIIAKDIISNISGEGKICHESSNLTQVVYYKNNDIIANIRNYLSNIIFHHAHNL